MSEMAFRARLSGVDLERLTAADPRLRAVSARKVCARISASGLDPSERRAGEAVLRALACDAADMVRRALAATLSRSPHLPPDLARRLIADIDEIAVPILAGSPSLTEDDLVCVARMGSTRRQCAVAGRDHVPVAVVEALVEAAPAEAVGIAAANDGAIFTPRTVDAALARFADAPRVFERFIERRRLPLEITEKLVSRISEGALRRLVSRHAVPAQLAVELADGARERATVDLVEQAGLAPDPRRFVQQLQMNGRLTSSLILRALFRGHVRFFEHALAELSGIEHVRAWVLIHDAGPGGLEALVKRAGMPEGQLPAIQAALAALASLETPDGSPEAVARWRRAIAERIFTQFQNAPDADLRYCLDRLDTDAAALSGAADILPFRSQA